MNSLLMGGPHSGTEASLGAPNPMPPAIRTCGVDDFVMLLHPIWHCGGPGDAPLGGPPRYVDMGWDRDYYRLTGHVTTGGLAIYEWVGADVLKQHGDAYINTHAVTRGNFD